MEICKLPVGSDFQNTLMVKRRENKTRGITNPNPPSKDGDNSLLVPRLR